MGNLLREEELLSLKRKGKKKPHKKQKQKNKLELQDNTRPKSVKSKWFLFPLVMDNISEFLPALELWCLTRGSL